MKHFSNFVLLLFFSFGISKAQQVVFSENFDAVPGYNPPTSWTESHSGALAWQCGLAYIVGSQCFTPPANSNNTKVCGFPDRYAGQIQVCINNNNMSDMFLYSPQINFSTVANAFLQFDSYFLKETINGISEGAYVEISDNNGNSWTRIFNVPGYTVGFKTWSIDLSVYNNFQNVSIGFRYSDSNQLRSGWLIDNVRVVIPSHKDIMLAAISPNDSLSGYTQTGQTVTLGGTVINNGLDTITSFSINYKQDNGAIKTQLFSGVFIPPFSSYNFIHNNPDTVFNAGNNYITMWASMTGDTIHTNDTQRTILHGAYFIPKKRLLIEEGTGTWNFNCPLGWVYMNDIANDNDLCEVSVHDFDPMQITDYHDYLFYFHWNYVPYFLFDRRENVAPENFYSYYYKQKDYFGFATINLDGNVFNNTLTVNAHIIPAVDLYGDYRLAMAVTEDDVQGTDSAYAQKNKYAGGMFGIMGGFENKPNPVPAADMHYNFVARTIQPAPNGISNTLPFAMVHNNTYDQTITAELNPAWHKNKLRAVVMLIRNSDSTVLNANKLQVPVGVDYINTFSLDAAVYPNPAADQTNIYFELKQQETINLSISDLSGRNLYIQPTKNYEAGRHIISVPLKQLSDGIYLITIATREGKKTMKLQVLR